MTRCVPAPHLRVVTAVTNEISGLLLGASGRWHVGLPIFLMKVEVLGFFSRQDGVLLDSFPH
jgi:hypothetical protein